MFSDRFGQFDGQAQGAVLALQGNGNIKTTKYFRAGMLVDEMRRLRDQPLLVLVALPSVSKLESCSIQSASRSR